LQLIEREHERGIPYEKIVLAGFSQGGAIALHTALRFDKRLAGLMALSTYLPLQSTLDAEVVNNALAQTRELPIFIAHGRSDPMLPLALGQHTFEVLTAAGYGPQWHDYPMAHAVCAEEIAHIRDWLLAIYAAQKA